MVDVLIAGAGPAGSLAAIGLARAGARVLLVDRARFPRDKLCGDTLNPGAMRVLDRVGLRGAVEAASRPLEGMLLTGNGGVQVRGTYGRGLMARALTRRVLDQLLVDAAIAAGAQFQDGVRVHAPMVEESGGRPTVRGAVLCRTGAGASPIRVPAQVTIAADGRHSTLAFALGLASHPPAPRRWAVGAYFEGLDGLETVGEMHVRGPHYIGVSPIGDRGLANVCLVTPARDGFADPAALLERHLAADPVLGPRAARARRVTAPSILGPLAVDAHAAGAQFQDGVRVHAPMVEESGGRPTVRGAVLCRTGAGASLMRVPAQVTIAADGRHSTLAFALGLASHPPAPRRWAVGAYFEGLDGLETVGEMHVRGPHYIGVSPIGDRGLANVCLVTPARDGFADPAALLERHLAADPVLGPRAARARRVTAPAILGPLAVDAHAAGVPGLLLAGDAAGFVDPMTGDGLRFALRGAELAVEVALAALEDPGIDAAAHLAAARTRAFGTKYGVNRLLRRLVGTPRRVSVMAISARVAPGILRRMIRYAGDVAA